MCVGAGNRVRVPEASKASLEDRTERGCVNPHRGNEGAVFVAFVEASPGCSKPRVGEEVWTSEVLSARTPVFNGPGVILVRPDDQNCRSEPQLILDLLFVFNFEPMLKEEVLEEKEVVVHG